MEERDPEGTFTPPLTVYHHHHHRNHGNSGDRRSEEHPVPPRGDQHMDVLHRRHRVCLHCLRPHFRLPHVAVHALRETRHREGDAV